MLAALRLGLVFATCAEQPIGQRCAIAVRATDNFLQWTCHAFIADCTLHDLFGHRSCRVLRKRERHADREAFCATDMIIMWWQQEYIAWFDRKGSTMRNQLLRLKAILGWAI